MVKLRNRFLMLFVMLHFASRLQAQGCSDAGICSAPVLRPTEQVDSTSNHRYGLSTGLGYGAAQFGVHVFAGFTELNRTFNKRFLVSAKVNYALNAGPLATNVGLADLLLTTAYHFDNGLSPFAGIKLPFNRANKAHNGRTLPMAYQTSLGTTDLLLGLSLAKKNWTLSVGYQQPLTANLNTFDTAAYSTGEIDERYLPTIGFNRKADVIMRFFYRFRLRNERISILPGILPIFHVANDTYTDAAGMEQTLYGSQGLTLNINAVMLYSLSKSSSLRFTAGAPALARKKRPEGLQKFSLIVEFATMF